MERTPRPILRWVLPAALAACVAMVVWRGAGWFGLEDSDGAAAKTVSPGADSEHAPLRGSRGGEGPGRTTPAGMPAGSAAADDPAPLDPGCPGGAAPGARIEGVVRWSDDRSPASPVTVYAYAAARVEQADADSSGAFRLGPIRAERVILVAVSRSPGNLYTKQEIALQAGGETVGVTLLIDRGATLEGVVLGESNLPLAGVRVKVDNKFQIYELPVEAWDIVPEGDKQICTTTDANGGFRIEGLIPSNEERRQERMSPPSGYTVWFTQSGYRPGWADAALYSDRRNFVEVRLWKTPLPLVVEGMVRDAAGNRAAGAAVHHRTRRKTSDLSVGRTGDKVKTDEWGNFRMSIPMDLVWVRQGRVVDRIWLVAEWPGFAPTHLSIEGLPGGHLSDLEIVLDPGGVIRGRVETIRGDPIPGAGVWISEIVDPGWYTLRETEADALGNFEFPAVRRVAYSASASAEGFLHDEIESVTAGDVDIRFVLERVPEGFRRPGTGFPKEVGERR